MKGGTVDASEKKKADARFGGDLVDALNMSKHEPLTETHLRFYAEVCEHLKAIRTSPARGISELISRFGRFAWDNEVDDVITNLLAEVAFQRGFANELIAMTVSGQGGSHAAAREIRARLDGARENERLRGELDSIIKVCADAGIGEDGQSALERVKEMHKALGEQIERADRANAT
jgi:hypothetical protein